MERPRPVNALIRVWTGFVVLVVYLPITVGALAGLSKSRYFGFPVKAWSFSWWEKVLTSFEIRVLLQNSLLVALCVTLISVLLGFFGALAFARYDWKGRRAFQKLSVLVKGRFRSMFGHP